MDRLDVMRLFVRVADSGSFSAAARAANIGQPAVSKQIAALEARLGAQLMRRTSRGLSLTQAGQDFYDSAVQLLEDFDAAESQIGKGQAAPSGLVRVAMSAGFGRMYVVPKLPEFFAAYPDITLDLDISERHVNLIEEGVDLAIRMGRLTDSSLLARRIGTMGMVTVAAPGYLERHGTPRTPAELAQHKAVIFMFRGAPRPWDFRDESGAFTIQPNGPIRANDAEHLLAAVLAGIGIGHNAAWLYEREIASGRLVRLLPDYAPDSYPIHAVTPGGRRVPGKVEVFIDFMAKICAGSETLRLR